MTRANVLLVAGLLGVLSAWWLATLVLQPAQQQQPHQGLGSPPFTAAGSPPPMADAATKVGEEISSSDVLTIRVAREYVSYPAETWSEVTFLASLLAHDSTTAPVDPASNAPPPRSPISLSIVADASGSMYGGKIEMLQASLRFLPRYFNATDRVGLVAFDGAVEVKLPMTYMDAQGKAAFIEAVNSLMDGRGGATNIDAGLLAGFDQLRGLVLDGNRYSGNFGVFADVEPTAAPPADHVAAVWMLTDGQVNRGVTSPDIIVGRLQARVNRYMPKATVHTFGYGDDHSSELLRKLAKSAEGTYYYVQQVNDVKTMFADCLGGMLSTVATNVTMHVGVAPEAARQGVKLVRTQSSLGELMPLSFKDLYAEEQRDVVLTFSLPPGTPESSLALGKIVITYVGAVKGDTLQLVHELSPVPWHGGGVAMPAEAAHAEVTTELMRLEVAEAMTNATRLMQEGRTKESQEILTRTSESLAHNATRSRVNASKVAYLSTVLNSSRLANSSHSLVNATQEVISQRGSSDESLYSNSRKKSMRTEAAEDSATAAAP